MSPVNQTPAADGAAAVAIAGETEPTNSLLDDAPEIQATPGFYDRFDRLRNYRGPIRNAISDADWSILLAGLKALASCKLTDEIVGFIAEGLQSIKDSRPAERLFSDFCAAAGYELAFEQWLEYQDRTPTTDYRSAFTAVHALSDWSALSDPPKTPATRFTPRIPNLTAPRPQWIVKGTVPEKALIVLYGKWGTGKSTFAIELCAAIAQGKPWHGRKVKQGPVVYVASENAHGTRARLQALLKDQGITLDDLDGRFFEISGRPHLLKPDEVQELIKELKPFGPALIVVDTLARATAGADENAVKEMMLAIENCQTIINSTGASVCLIHHSGKDESRGSRGSSALPAGADTEIILERPDDTQNLRVAKLGKQRDAPDYCDLFNYELKVVELGVDEDGDKITSTVVREIEPKAKSNITVVEFKNTPIRLAIRGVLEKAQRATPFDELITSAVVRLAPPDPGTKDRRRDRVKQAFERMIAEHELHMDANGLVSLLIPGMPFAPVAADQLSDLVGGAA